jgi:hypothetical protein
LLCEKLDVIFRDGKRRNGHGREDLISGVVGLRGFSEWM